MSLISGLVRFFGLPRSEKSEYYSGFMFFKAKKSNNTFCLDFYLSIQLGVVKNKQNHS
jgi:hypothetical protein